MTLARLAAVLFDLDGTLVDSQKTWDVAMSDLAVHYGGTLTEETRQATVGAATPQAVRILLDAIGLVNLPVDEVDAAAQWLETRVAELLVDDVQWCPGAPELLAAVHRAGLPTALVTNTKRALVDQILRSVGVHTFAAVVCGDEVTRSKPDPEPYLTAAAALGVPARACLVLEDSPSGIASALAAGCTVLGVAGQTDLSGAGVPVLASLVGVDLARLNALALSGGSLAGP